jgi:hypothetical protein
MQNVLYAPATNGLMKVAKVLRSNQKFTYVQEMDCSHDERYLAAQWLSVAPEKRYANKDFNTYFKELNEEERA